MVALVEIGAAAVEAKNMLEDPSAQRVGLFPGSRELPKMKARSSTMSAVRTISSPLSFLFSTNVRYSEI
jgi:hypothetical protein